MTYPLGLPSCARCCSVVFGLRSLIAGFARVFWPNYYFDLEAARRYPRGGFFDPAPLVMFALFGAAIR